MYLRKTHVRLRLICHTTAINGRLFLTLQQKYGFNTQLGIP
jgi:hypothetical protein